MKKLILGLVIGFVLGSGVAVLADLPLDRNQREILKFQEAADGSVAVNIYLTE